MMGLMQRISVLVDFTQIPLSRTGVGVYADHLVTNLLPLLRKDDLLTLVVQSDDLLIRAAVNGYANVHLVTIPSKFFRNRALLMIYEQLVLPIVAWAKRANLIHSLHYTHPLLSLTRRVVTIHDLTFLLFPELHTRSRRIVMPFFIRRAMKHADAVIFVSKATQDDAERLIGTGHNLRRVVPLGVAACPPAQQGDPSSETYLSGIGVQQPYLLFVGTLEPRKNIVRIVNAFESVAETHPELTLVLAGKLGWHTDEIISAIEHSPMRPRIRYLGFVSEAQKRTLLRNCAMLVYPSLYEGFGLPVLEGMAAGAPVITSNLSSMPEVAGDAAVFVDPTSSDAIAAAIGKILRDVILATRLQKAGPAQASLFTWGRTATLTLDLYRDARCTDHEPSRSAFE
ncbi:MAG TPA: glycosyltransferase family 1 protein [Acidobacteriaceae bacterium]|jgi:glycosyltransferase involved in cell wall biosynthesis|nr:glycosyltransferase family 1 protein [Acidobacteriaceae bacterium]